ncbi:MAG: PQQ-binding-like beta-propeller repeat protein [Ignavibacteriales bacterium]|nr:MAG: PQQ-binding-like beta-propeller repeat protein [Ignavibacteriales bacterium]
MKKFYLLLFFLSFAATIYSQNKTAWIFDPQAGSESNDMKFREILSNISQRNDIENIIVTGNISLNSSEEQFLSLKAVTDTIEKKFYFIPGTNDYNWLNGNSEIFKNIFNDDKFYLKQNDAVFIGMTSAIERRGEGGHFRREDLEWLKSLSDTFPDNIPVILFLNQPLNQTVDNWFKVTNALLNKNVLFILSSEGDETKATTVNSVITINAKGFTSKNKEWSYFILDTSDDTLQLIESFKSGKENTIINQSINSPASFNVIDSIDFVSWESQLMWKYDLNNSINNSLVVKDDLIFASTPDGEITCLTRSGQVKWKTKIGGSSINNLVKEGDLLVTGTLEGDLISLNANTGDVFLTIGVGEPITSRLTSASIEVPEGKIRVVILGTVNGNVYCYNIYSFELLWQNSSATDMIESEPMVINNRIIFGSWDSNLYCVDSRSGILNWKWSSGNNFYFAPARCTPVSDGKNVFITSPDKNVYAIDLLLGTLNWKKEFSAWESAGISQDKKQVYIKSFRDKLNIISSADGKLIKELDLKNGFDTTPLEIKVWNENILLPLKNGTLLLVDKSYNQKKIMFTGNSRLNQVFHFYDDVFVTSNSDGIIYCFNLKK